MKKALVLMMALTVLAAGAAFAKPKQWVVGFSQIGSESEWRTACTVSVQNAFNDDPSFVLIYSDAQQKQENQIKALRAFIAQKVDVIALSPVVETGWGTVLREAKAAGVHVFGGGINRDVAPLMVAADGTVTSETYPQTREFDGGFCVLELPSREVAVHWAAKLAKACRCPQELREFGYDPES